MQIHLEQAEAHAIKGYSEQEIKVGSEIYDSSLIISREQIIPNWPIHRLQELSDLLLQPLLEMEPEVVIIGHSETGKLPSPTIYAHLSKLQIGLECMSIGAASRTFNVLLSEHRSVVAGFIFLSLYGTIF